jgi:hypothetical protein
MAADAWVLHDKAKEYMGDGTIDLDADTFKVALYLSTSNVATTSIDALASATNQHANANGYSTGGVALGSVTWTSAGATVTFDAADMTDAWTAAGGSIVCRFAVLYDDTVTTPVADPIIAHSLLDNTPLNVTVTDTNTLSITFPVGGIFTAS